MCRVEDERRLFEWQIENPIKPHLVIRWVAAVYARQEVPEKGTEEEMLDYVRKLAMKFRCKCWFVVSHWICYAVERDGSWRVVRGVNSGPVARLDVGALVGNIVG